MLRRPLTPPRIKKLPDIIKKIDAERCSICNCNYVDFDVIADMNQCKTIPHRFHKDCIESWIEHQQQSSVHDIVEREVTLWNRGQSRREVYHEVRGEPSGICPCPDCRAPWDLSKNMGDITCAQVALDLDDFYAIRKIHYASLIEDRNKIIEKQIAWDVAHSRSGSNVIRSRSIMYDMEENPLKYSLG